MNRSEWSFFVSIEITDTKIALYGKAGEKHKIKQERGVCRQEKGVINKRLER